MCDSPRAAKRPRFSFVKDVIVEVAEGETIPVHSHVLMAASEVFATMLQSEMQEAHTGRIILKDKTRAELEEVLKHLDLRAGALPPPVTRDNVELLLQFADEYQVTGLRDRCIPLMKELSEYEAFHFLRVSSRFKVPEVIRFCTQKLLEHYVEEAREDYVDDTCSACRSPKDPAYRLNKLVKNLLNELEDDVTVRNMLYDELFKMICSADESQLEKVAMRRGRSKHWLTFVNTFLELKKVLVCQPSEQDNFEMIFSKEWTKTLMPLFRMAMDDFEQKREEEYQELLRNPAIDLEEEEEEEEKDKDDDDQENEDDQDDQDDADDGDQGSSSSSSD